VVVPPAYESVPSSAGREELSLRLRAGEVDCVTFTASSTVENFVAAFGEEEAVRLLSGTRVVCIGPITAGTARERGLRVDAEAAEYTIPGLVEAVTHLLAGDLAKRSE
jgi:uroporphyrinogen III methyltransferase/synthase